MLPGLAELLFPSEKGQQRTIESPEHFAEPMQRADDAGNTQKKIQNNWSY